MSNSVTPPPLPENPSTRNFSNDVMEEIAVDDIYTANCVYSFFAALGFAAGCFLFYSFSQSYRAQRRLAWIDGLLCVYSGVQMLLLLLSLYAVAYRPSYPRTTALGCAALSFTINTVSLCGLFVLVLMAYVLTLDPPSSAPLRKARVCAGVVGVSSLLIALILAGIRGPREDLQNTMNCFMDKGEAGVSYPAAKLCLTFLIPFSFILVLLICGCIRQKKSKGRFLSGSEEGPVFLAVTAVVLVCQLFYGISLVRSARQGEEIGQHRKAFLSVSEFVLFTGSSASLLLVLLVHRTSRESLRGIFSQMRDCCRSPVRAQTTRNIITPHIEITDTLQDIES